MGTGQIGHITFEGNLNCEYIKFIIQKAINFLNRQLKTDVSDIDCHCIISKKYDIDVQKHHGSASKDNTSNGMYIPVFYQRNPSNKPIIIFNWTKIKKAPETFITSVFVHEFTHLVDYLVCSELEVKYGSIFMLHVESDSFPDRIGGVHSVRSEMRAKYFQEKYECSLLTKGSCIQKRINHHAAKVSDIKDHYNAAHLTGQYLCWQECAETYPELAKAVSAVKEQLSTLYAYNPCLNYQDVFSEEAFLKKCEEIDQEFHQQRNT